MRPLLFLLLAGCAEYDLSSDTSQAEFDTGVEAALRLDVYPTAEMVGADGQAFVAQTWYVTTTRAGSAELILEPSVTLEGTVAAYRVSPWADADLPGTTVQVEEARVSITRDGTLQSAATTTQGGAQPEPGAFSVQVAPSSEYIASFVPEDPTLPFASMPMSLLEDTEVEVDLGAGVAIWGEAVDTEGQPLVGVGVRAVDAYGVAGPLARTSAQGFFLLKVQPDAVYKVVAEGRDDGLDPQLTEQDLVVGPEGASLDFLYAPRDLRTVRGRAVNAEGQGLRGVIAHFVARELDGYGAAASFDIAFQTNADGHFSAVLLPGRYDLELIPGAGVGVSPLLVTDVLVDDPLEDLGASAMAPLALVEGVAVDPASNPVPGALLTVTEIGFGERVWQATADGAGRFAIEAPRSPVTFELTPPADRPDLAITRITAASAAEAPEMILSGGQEISGTIQWRDADGDLQPAPFTVVEARDADGVRRGVALTNADGAYTMRIAP